MTPLRSQLRGAGPTSSYSARIYAGGLLFGGVPAFFFALVSKTLAICPICTIAVAAGVGIAEEYGVDDTIIGVWLGALTLSMAIWNMHWFDKKNIHFFLRDFFTAFFYYLIVVVPFSFIMKDVIGYPGHLLWGIDKLYLGIFVGTFAFYFGAEWYQRIKAQRGHAHFPFQKVVMPVAPLILLSILFYFITY